MSGTKIDLSHEEVWDDSALLESWNDALREYKKYHSIFKKGVTKADLDALNAERAANNTELEMDLESNTQSESMAEKYMRSESAAPLSEALAAPAFHPQVVLGSMKDENLKKMLMSWYYAGYYTGLYEGQQQQQQGAASSSS